MLKECVIGMIEWNPIAKLVKWFLSIVVEFNLSPVAQYVVVILMASFVSWLILLLLRSGLKNMGRSLFNWSPLRMFLFVCAVSTLLIIVTEGSVIYIIGLSIYAGMPLVFAFWLFSLARKIWRQKKSARMGSGSMNSRHEEISRSIEEEPLFAIDNEVPASEWIRRFNSIALALGGIYLLFAYEYNFSAAAPKFADFLFRELKIVVAGMFYFLYHFSVIKFSRKPQLLFFEDKVVSTNKEVSFLKVYRENSIAKEELRSCRFIKARNLHPVFKRRPRIWIIVVFFPVIIFPLVFETLSSFVTKLLYDAMNVLNLGPSYSSFILEKDSRKNFPLWVRQEDREKIKEYFRKYWNVDIEPGTFKFL